jgi:hypothetical protein
VNLSIGQIEVKMKHKTEERERGACLIEHLIKHIKNNLNNNNTPFSTAYVVG